MAKFNFYFGAATSAWLLLILIIVAELIEPFKTLLKNTFGHHWIGKSVIIILAFLVIGFLLRNNKSIGKVKQDKIAWYSTLFSLIAILLFFAIEYFK